MKWTLSAALLATLAGCLRADDMKLRNEMVTNQLERGGITDAAVLQAMREVPRHEFVPTSLRDRAYEDGPLPIGQGQTISQPFIVALMTQILGLKPESKVLEIGTGSGYQAAVLAKLAKDVYTIEIVKELADGAQGTLARLGYKNIHVRAGDGYKGWPEAAPFDGIIVTCAPEKVPQPLLDQLSDGGRMAIPVGQAGGVQELVLIEKNGGQLKKTRILDVRFVPMTGEAEVGTD